MSEHHPIKMLSNPVGLSLSNQNFKRVSFSELSLPITPTKSTSPRAALQHTRSELTLINRLHAMDQESEHIEAITKYTSVTRDIISTTSQSQETDSSSMSHVKQNSVELSTERNEIINDDITQSDRKLEPSPIIDDNRGIDTSFSDSDFITVISKRSNINNNATVNDQNSDSVPRSEVNKNAFDVLLDYGSIDSANVVDVTVNKDDATLDSQTVVSSTENEVNTDISDNIPKSGSTERVEEHAVIIDDDEVPNNDNVVPSPTIEVDIKISEAFPDSSSSETINGHDTPYSDAAPTTEDVLPSLRSEVDIEYSKFVETVSEVTAAIDAALGVSAVASPTIEDIIDFPGNRGDSDPVNILKQDIAASERGSDESNDPLPPIEKQISDLFSDNVESEIVELIPELASLTLKEIPLPTDEANKDISDKFQDLEAVEAITDRTMCAQEAAPNTSEEAPSTKMGNGMDIDNSHASDTVGDTEQAPLSSESGSNTIKKPSSPISEDNMDSSDSFIRETSESQLPAEMPPNPTSLISGIGIPYGTALIDLYIGPTATHFKIHKNLLCQIPYFSRMFDGGHFKESHDQTAHFPDDSPETFALFLEWLYSKRCDSISGGVKKRDGRAQVNDMDIVKFYVLGQMMVQPLLQDCAVSLLLDCYQWRREYPGLATMAYIYKNTPEGSGARKFIAETIHSIIKRPFRREDHELNMKALTGLMANNKEMLYDVMVLSNGDKERDWVHGGVRVSYDLRRCLFHEHGKEGEKACLYK